MQVRSEVVTWPYGFGAIAVERDKVEVGVGVRDGIMKGLEPRVVDSKFFTVVAFAFRRTIDGVTESRFLTNLHETSCWSRSLTGSRCLFRQGAISSKTPSNS